MEPPALWTGGAQVFGAVFASKIWGSFSDSSSLPHELQECPGAFKESEVVTRVLLPSLQCLTHQFVLEESGSGAAAGLVGFLVNVRLCSVPGSATDFQLWALGTTKWSGPLVHC